jgi:hypothetical protein
VGASLLSLAGNAERATTGSMGEHRMPALGRTRLPADRELRPALDREGDNAYYTRGGDGAWRLDAGARCSTAPRGCEAWPSGDLCPGRRQGRRQRHSRAPWCAEGRHVR